jgi:hypothetical membrane protein
MRTLASFSRWTARLLSLASIGLLLMFMFGEGLNPTKLHARELILLCFFPIGVIVGMILAWRRESLGGMVAVASLAAFYAVHWAGAGRWPQGAAFLAFTCPAFLFLLAAHLRTYRPD